jgi:hypothetical protein
MSGGLSEAMMWVDPSRTIMFITMSSPPGIRSSGEGASPLRITPSTVPPSVSA